MSTVAHISLEQYERMIETGCFDGKFHQRVELIRGEIHAMNPIGSRHEMAVMSLSDWSYQTVPLDKVMIRVQMTLRVPPLESVPQPDLAWVRRSDYFSLAPEAVDALLVIEVADSSLAGDRSEKARLYAEAEIADYWIVNLIDKCVEVFRNPQGGKYQSVTTYRNDECVSPLAFPQASFSPTMLFGS